MGFTAKEIAEQLNLSRRTVESYFALIRHVYGCRNSKELIAKYYNRQSFYNYIYGKNKRIDALISGSTRKYSSFLSRLM